MTEPIRAWRRKSGRKNIETKDSIAVRSTSISHQVSEMNERIRECKLCRLCEARNLAVPGSGLVGKDLGVMFVGEGPGRNEDLRGEPFVGAGGKLLDSALKMAGLDRCSVFITNIVKCRPPENRRPLEDEIEICTSNYLDRQIELLKPKLICTLGATALEYFIGKKSIGKLHGKLLKSDTSTLLFPAYHPAAIFRNRSLKPIFEREIGMIPKILKQIETKG